MPDLTGPVAGRHAIETQLKLIQLLAAVSSKLV